MKISETVTFTCFKNCGFKETSTSKYVVIQEALRHIKYFHPELYQALERRGRELAMCNNGCGYSDSGKGTAGGWFEAHSDFREAWVERALASRLKSWKSQEDIF